MSSKYKIETILLRLCYLKGPHSRENIAETIVAVIKTYEISSKIGYFVLNNAGLNNIYISAIIKWLNIKDTKEHRCLCCLSYVLNLSVKAIFFSENPKVFEKDIITAAILRDKKAALRHWRSKGALGKLHNVINYIRLTPQWREDFLAKACKGVKELELITETKGHLDEDLETKDPLILIQDNDTRWNSWFLMIRQALNLRDTINLFIKHYIKKNKSSLSKLDKLSNSN